MTGGVVWHTIANKGIRISFRPHWGDAGVAAAGYRMEVTYAIPIPRETGTLAPFVRDHAENAVHTYHFGAGEGWA